MTDLPSPKERRRLREAKALTEKELAGLIGVTEATVRSWESGRTNPQGRRRKAYARVLASAAAPEPDSGAAAQTEQPGTRPAPLLAKPAAPSRQHGARTRPLPASKRATRSKAPAPVRHPRSSASGRMTVTTKVDTEPRAELSPATAPVVPGIPEAPVAPAVTGRPPQHPPATATAPGHPDADTEPLGLPDPGTARTYETDDPESPRTTPAEAFDLLYTREAPALVHQTYLLSGRRRLAQESVERAFHLAWERWPEVATDRDPAGWVRAAAYEYAMSPWHRLRRSHKHPDPPTTAPEQAPLREALLALPPAYRRTLLLYDGLGLDLPETAAETEASTPATANRLLHARAAVAERVPDLRTPDMFQERLAALTLTGLDTKLPAACSVRAGCERRARFWTRLTIGCVALLAVVTAFTLATAPTHYARPTGPPQRVEGVPPRGGPQPLTPTDKKLRKKLRTAQQRGPAPLIPQPH